MARRSLALLLASSLALMAAAVASADSWLYDKFNTDGTVRTQYDASGQEVAMLSLDRSSGAGFNSKEQAARRRRVGHHPVGREQLHALQLLRRRLAVPPGPPARVQPQLS
ncbi:xyloglucan endo-transglycosylase/hydrolase1 [Zea mays]|uniref:Xyloglucan endo-transglycosylase/hydrolase1 n=1 Tax=Zea mays TaxID=4577 RepID=A0A1D6IZ01_MAIZE|nr:xyloglucan endo-transglycosylase/hydrolase1 [Zea mays]